MGNIIVFIIVVGVLVAKSVAENAKAEREKSAATKAAPQPAVQTPPHDKRPNAAARQTPPHDATPREEPTARNAAAESFRNLDELKKAVIYTEILNRKY